MAIRQDPLATHGSFKESNARLSSASCTSLTHVTPQGGSNEYVWGTVRRRGRLTVARRYLRAKRSKLPSPQLLAQQNHTQFPNPPFRLVRSDDRSIASGKGAHEQDRLGSTHLATYRSVTKLQRGANSGPSRHALSKRYESFPLPSVWLSPLASTRQGSPVTLPLVRSSISGQRPLHSRITAPRRRTLDFVPAVSASVSSVR